MVSEAVVVMKNCAREPEVEELCTFLNQAGANIQGGGTDTIIVYGVKELREIRYTIRSDRIAAGTFLAMAAATKGSVTIQGISKASKPIESFFVFSKSWSVASLEVLAIASSASYANAIGSATVRNMIASVLHTTAPIM